MDGSACAVMIGRIIWWKNIGVKYMKEVSTMNSAE